MSDTGILNAVGVPVFALDDELRVVSANPKARDLFRGIDPERSIDDVISRKRKFMNALQKTRDTGQKSKVKIAFKGGFGSEHLATVIAAERRETSENAALIVTLEDLSPVLDAKTMRSDFIANVSHEIRSPLTAIAGFVETLRGPARNDVDAQDHFLELMEKEVLRMTNLVRDLLSLSKVEVKERKFPKKLIKPDQVIRQAEETASNFAERNGKSLIVREVPSLPHIRGNHDDLVRVMINLLENAVTYSREGSTVEVQLNTVDAPNPLGKSALRISVRDEGEGIPASEIPRLTERFYRVDKSRSRNVGGTGLGLAIVKHILVRHRGKLDIESTVGKGSVFHVYLPLKISKK